LFSLFLGQGPHRGQQGGGGHEGGRDGPGHRGNSPASIVARFYGEGKEAIGVINEAIRRYNNNTALVTQLQTIRSAFAICEQTAVQNLATALNVTVPTTTTTTTTTTTLSG